MVVMRALLKAAGLELPLDIARVWGTMLTLHGTLGWLVGLLIHLVGSGGIALIYAWVFDWIGADDHLWLWGLTGGVIHWVIAGLFFAILPPLHPEIPEERPAPGAFLARFGAPSVPVFLVGHAMFGVVVGVLYALLHPEGGTARLL